ncbi:MAG: hypothetical protein P8J50_03300 [Acidimicrobiales bacterium]|jgi:hypothetical protein|nr:hypothetical protein [Acidimicrobiales bacterium]
MSSLLLCKGKDCASECKREFDDLTVRAETSGLEVGLVRCQGACTGPTAVVVGPDGPRWFEDLKSTKAQEDLCAFALGTEVELPRRLLRRELTGKARKKAEKKLAKQ